MSCVRFIMISKWHSGSCWSLRQNKARKNEKTERDTKMLLIPNTGIIMYGKVGASEKREKTSDNQVADKSSASDRSAESKVLNWIRFR